MNTFIRRQLNNLNRLIIVALTFVGLAIDDYQFTDIIFGLSVLIWLFLPEINKIEAIGLDKLVRSKDAGAS